MSNLKVIRISGGDAVRVGVPQDAQFLCGFPEYETVTVTDESGSAESPAKTHTETRPSGEHTLYFALRPSVSPESFVSAMREANKRDTESFDTESRTLLRQLTGDL